MIINKGLVCVKQVREYILFTYAVLGGKLRGARS